METQCCNVCSNGETMLLNSLRYCVMILLKGGQGCDIQKEVLCLIYEKKKCFGFLKKD